MHAVQPHIVPPHLSDNENIERSVAIRTIPILTVGSDPNEVIDTDLDLISSKMTNEGEEDIVVDNDFLDDETLSNVIENFLTPDEDATDEELEQNKRAFDATVLEESAVDKAAMISPKRRRQRRPGIGEKPYKKGKWL